MSQTTTILHTIAGFKCEDCENSFISKDEQKKHKQISHTSDNFEFILGNTNLIHCERCDDEFESEVDLEDHLKKKHTETMNISPSLSINVAINKNTIENEDSGEHLEKKRNIMSPEQEERVLKQIEKIMLGTSEIT